MGWEPLEVSLGKRLGYGTLSAVQPRVHVTRRCRVTRRVPRAQARPEAAARPRPPGLLNQTAFAVPGRVGFPRRHPWSHCLQHAFLKAARLHAHSTRSVSRHYRAGAPAVFVSA